MRHTLALDIALDMALVRACLALPTPADYSAAYLLELTTSALDGARAHVPDSTTNMAQFYVGGLSTGSSLSRTRGT